MPPRAQAKLTSLPTERDVRLLNNMSASCLMLRRLHMKQDGTVRAQT
jgi:hypothetical protein